MKKFSAAVRTCDAEKLLYELQRLGCARLEYLNEARETSADDDLPEYALPEEIASAAALPGFDNSEELASLSSEIASARTALEFLTDAYTGKHPMFLRPEEVDADEFERDTLGDARKCASEALEIKDAIAGAEKKIQLLGDEIASCEPFAHSEFELPESMTARTATVCGTLPPSIGDEEITSALGDYACTVDVISTGKNGSAVAMTAHRDDFDSCMSALSSLGFTQTQAQASADEGYADGVIASCIAETDFENQKLTELRERAKALADGKLTEMRVYLDYLTTAEARLREKNKMRQTERCSVIGGWVSVRYAGKLEKLFGDVGAAYSFDEPEPEKESVPIILSNGAFGSQFEPIVGLYSYPSYGAFDPTTVMGVFYILIFGLMFADVGYGLTLTVGCLLGLKLMRPKESLARFLRMFAMCGVASMVGGALFGGYFGDMPTRIMEDFLGIEKAPDMALCFNMIDNPILFLVISLAMGALHLLTGMAIKFGITVRDGHPVAAVFDVGSWFILFTGIGLYFVFPTAGMICALIGALMLIFSQGRAEKNPIMKLLKGILSLYDIVSYGSDLLSYSRILALSLASAVIANVVNIFGAMGGPGIGGVISMTLAFLLGHTLNFAVNLLGTYVHTSRLQYIEFFGKFFEDGGREFVPLAPDTKYTVFK